MDNELRAVLRRLLEEQVEINVDNEQGFKEALYDAVNDVSEQIEEHLGTLAHELEVIVERSHKGNVAAYLDVQRNRERVHNANIEAERQRDMRLGKNGYRGCR